MATLLHFTRNTLFGGIAAFIVWAGYGGAGQHVGTQQIAASLILGGGGVAIVNAAVVKSVAVHGWQKVYDEAVKAVREVSGSGE